MLAYILAIAVGLASLSLYLSAFFVPEIHRKDDFLWSGVGLFYALILWICAGKVTGSVLLGQGAVVALVLSFGWQTVRLRRAIASPDEQTNLEEVSIMSWLQNRFSGQKTAPSQVKEDKKTAKPSPVAEKPSAEPEYQPEVSSVIESPSISTPESIDNSTEELKIEEKTQEVEKAKVTLPEELEELEELEDDNDLDFEAFISDDEAETVIEADQPKDLSASVSPQTESTKIQEVSDEKKDDSPAITDHSPETPEDPK